MTSPIEGLGVRLHNRDNPLLAFVEVVEAPDVVHISVEMMRMWFDGLGQNVRVRKMSYGPRDTRALVTLGTEGYGQGEVSYVVDFSEPLHAGIAYVARRYDA